MPIEAITEEDAHRAGLELEKLLDFLNQKSEGEDYRVELGSVGADPRVALREDDDLTDEDVAELWNRSNPMCSTRSSARPTPTIWW